MLEHSDHSTSLSETCDLWAVRIAILLPIAVVLGNVAFELITGLTGLLWLIRISFVHDGISGRLLKHSFLWPMTAWMAAVIFSRFFNHITPYLFFHDLSFVRYILFVLALVDISRRLPVDRYLMIGLAAGVAWAALATICVYIFGADFIGRPLIRYTGKLKEAARIAALCAYAAPFFSVWLISDKRLVGHRKLAVFAVSAAAFVLLLVMHIRTALLAAAIGLVGGLILALNRRQRWIAIGGLFAVLLIGMTIAAQIGYLGDLSSIYTRLYIWKVCLVLWWSKPMLGVGISSFQEAYHQLAVSGSVAPYIAPDGVVYQLDFVSHPHNLVLQLLTCSGLIGLASFVWSAITAVNLWRLKKNQWRVGLGAWPFVLVGIGITGWNIYDPFYTCLVIYFMAWMGCRPADEFAGTILFEGK